MTKTNKIAMIIKIALIILALALLIPAMSKDAQAATKNGISYTKKTKTWNYYTKGKINKKFTNLAKYKGTWYFVQKGTVNFKKTGLVKFKGAWYYVQSGKVNFKKNGLVKHTNNKIYFVQNGKINFKKNGSYTQSGVKYTIKNGVATKQATAVKAATVKTAAASAMPAASHTATTTTTNTTSKNRLIISSVGINVGTYAAPINNLKASQKIVDAADSAAVMNNGYQTVIADHVHQGFTNLKNVKVGTTATFNGKTYRCTLNTRAYNRGSDLVDVKTGKGYYYTNQGGLTIYTCVYNSDQITLTQWVAA